MIDRFDVRRSERDQDRRERHLAKCRKHPVSAGDMRTTPPPIIDLPSVVPELAGTERTTVRLHPRYGEQPLSDESKLGGRFIWPDTEHWPCCETHGIAYVTVLQLRKEDVPEMEFRPRTDLFQLLWCPRDHAPWTSQKVFWRRRAAIKSAIVADPFPEKGYAEYIPVPCRLFPERVTEYPFVSYISSNSKKAITELIISKNINLGDILPEEYYEWSLSTAPGTKVGGYVHWIQGDAIPNCRCGKPMEHLVTIASCEYHAGTAERWMPFEDRATREADPIGTRGMANASGLLLGDLGNIYYFICRECADWPVRDVCQCS